MLPLYYYNQKKNAKNEVDKPLYGMYNKSSVNMKAYVFMQVTFR